MAHKITTPNGTTIRTQSHFRYIVIHEYEVGEKVYRAEIVKRTDNFETAKKVRSGRYHTYLIFDTVTGEFRVPDSITL